MQRQLKFRAWDSHEGKWLFGYEMPNLGGFSLIGETVLFGELNRFSLGYYQHIIFTQFTDLKDKNGKEIYEGDIVRWFKTEYDWDKPDGEEATKIDVYSKIVYRNHGFWVNDEGFGYEGEDLWNWDEMEVIGNIFENPELNTQAGGV